MNNANIIMALSSALKNPGGLELGLAGDIHSKFLELLFVN
jgi:hypothetical protein